MTLIAPRTARTRQSAMTACRAARHYQAEAVGRVYRHAASVLGVGPARLVLVAARAWDCHETGRPGLTTGWVSRLERKYSPIFACTASELGAGPVTYGLAGRAGCARITARGFPSADHDGAGTEL